MKNIGSRLEVYNNKAKKTGGGNCKLVKAIGNYFNISNKNIYCCDIEDNVNTKDIKFKLIKENTKLPYKDNQFDCIIVRKVISYIKDLKFILNEWKRILKKKGIIYIQETSSINDFDYLISDIQRMSSMYKNNKMSKKKNYNVKYYDKFELRNIFENNNFKFIKDGDKFWDITKPRSVVNMNWLLFYNNK